jgi:peptidoglycan-N-acetylglucosamine deacetylase
VVPGQSALTAPETALRERIPLTVLIWQDDAYGLIRWKMDLEFGRDVATGFAKDVTLQTAPGPGSPPARHATSPPPCSCRPPSATPSRRRPEQLAGKGERGRSGSWSGFTRTWAPAAPAALAAGLPGTDWTRVPAGSKVVALTFDAGANAAGLASIESTLRAKGVPATFFLTGAWVRDFPAQASMIVQDGFLVGNHSMSHPEPGFTQLTGAQVAAEVQGAQQAILRADGADARPLFRFPFGDVNSRVLADVNGLGYVAVRWTVDSLGWEGASGGQSVQAVTNRVLAAAQPGEIVLMHLGSNPDDGTTLDAAALPAIIDGLRARGYSFVTLQALTG